MEDGGEGEEDSLIDVTLSAMYRDLLGLPSNRTKSTETWWN